MKLGRFYSEGGEGPGGAPRNSATVILLRERDRGPFEVFLMRRHRGQAFMGGAFVFPGGALEEGDAAREIEACLEGFGQADAQRLLQEPDLPGTLALGLFLAAIRETFEEAGILLARDASSGRTIDLTDPDRASRFSRYRLDLHAGRLGLAQLAGQEGLLYAPDLLTPYSHWITPEIEARRFDTRFFLARLPAGQVPTHDRMELTESRWMTPADALAEHDAGRIVLMPPTLKTMEELQAHAATESLFAAARSRQIRAILPEARRTDDGFALLLPEDPEYSLASDRQPPRAGQTTRIVLRDGIWRTLTA